MIGAQDISEIWSPFLNYLTKLEKELKCFVCNGLLRIPKLLPCNHIVCSGCIITVVTPSELTRERVCLSCQKPFRYEDTRHAFHAARTVSLFQEMDAALGSIIQQRASPKNVPGDEQPGVHNAQVKASNSRLFKKSLLVGDAPPVHNAQHKPSHPQSPGFPSANYRNSKKRVYEGNYETMPNRSMNSEKVSRLKVPSNLKESSHHPSFGENSGSKLQKHGSYPEQLNNQSTGPSLAPQRSGPYSSFPSRSHPPQGFIGRLELSSSSRRRPSEGLPPLPGVTSVQDIPRVPTSSAAPGSLSARVRAAAEEAAKKKSFEALGDSVIVTMTEAMRDRLAEVEARQVPPSQVSEEAKVETVRYKAEATAYSEQLNQARQELETAKAASLEKQMLELRARMHETEQRVMKLESQVATEKKRRKKKIQEVVKLRARLHETEQRAKQLKSQVATGKKRGKVASAELKAGNFEREADTARAVR